MILESTSPQSEVDLKRKLMEIARQRGLPYALYVETMGPRLESCGCSIASIRTMGTRELVRGSVFGDLDVRSLRRELIAAGDTPTSKLILSRFLTVSPAQRFYSMSCR